MSFCPLESYEWDEVEAECGSSGVLLMASLLPICDIRSGAQGNCQEGRRLSVCFCTIVCVCVCEEMKRGKRTKRAKQLVVPEMIQRKAKVKRRWIGRDERRGGRREVETRFWRNGALEGRGFWLKGYFLSQGSSCQSDSMAFVVPPFHCDLTLSQGETRDKHTGLSSISHLTQSPSHSLSLPLTWLSKLHNLLNNYVLKQRKTETAAARPISQI